MAFTVAVPNVPGVPSVIFAINSPVTPIALTADLIADPFYSTPQWGLYQGGAPVITADTVTAVDYRKEYTISDYPVEEGGFESFDKVELPGDFRLRFASGNAATRATLISSLQAVVGTTQVFSGVTPDVVYPSFTISHLDYRRTASNGVNLLQIDVWCLEVRQTGSATNSNASAASGNDAQNGGAVQPGTPTATQSATVLNSPEFSGVTQPVPSLANSGE